MKTVFCKKAILLNTSGRALFTPNFEKNNSKTHFFNENGHFFEKISSLNKKKKLNNARKRRTAHRFSA